MLERAVLFRPLGCIVTTYGNIESLQSDSVLGSHRGKKREVRFESPERNYVSLQRGQQGRICPTALSNLVHYPPSATTAKIMREIPRYSLLCTTHLCNIKVAQRYSSRLLLLYIRSHPFVYVAAFQKP